jgi:hypothetical protein
MNFRWTSNLPEIGPGSKRMKLMNECEKSRESLINTYTKCPQILKSLTKNETIFLIDFLWNLIQNLTNNDPNSIALATNLIPELSPKLEDLLLQTLDSTPGHPFTYLNFMIRSYKYFQAPPHTLHQDALFNKLFFTLKNIVQKAEYPTLLPDFLQVFFELLYRNSLTNTIEMSNFETTVKTLTTAEDLATVNNAFPQFFLLFGYLKVQTEDFGLKSMFKAYFDRVLEVVKQEEEVKFEELREMNVRKIKKKNGQVVGDGRNKQSTKVRKEYENKQKEKVLNRFYQARNFVDLMFTAIEALVCLVGQDMEEEKKENQEIEFTVHTAKYCNK